jgi:hypothetical protein
VTNRNSRHGPSRDAEKPNPGFTEGYDGSAWEYYGNPGFASVASFGGTSSPDTNA